jgi:hypothetical protein
VGSGISTPGECLEPGGDTLADDEGPGSELAVDCSLVGVSDIVVEEKEVVSIGILIRESAKR